ncbi:hypothetical protein OSTOST_07977, partial [Ostertagia ostertagi]
IQPVPGQYLVGREVYAFIAFQRIPGPLAKDHDVMYHIENLNGSNFIYLPVGKLHNKTGLYYVGIGMVDKNGKKCVKYEPPPGISDGNWCFIRDFEFNFNVRVLTKGCYFYRNSTDRIDNVHDVAAPFYGSKIVQCSIHHLTTFFVGLFNPVAEGHFSYEYVVQHKLPNVTAAMIVFFLSIHMVLVVICGLNQQVMDLDRGLLYNMADNNPGDLVYYYIVMVETGYRMCASTDSKVFITIYGTDADEVSRELKTIHIERNSSIFSWGTSARFSSENTMVPRGDLRFVRLWVDNSGS